MADRTPPADLVDTLDDALREAEFGGYYRPIDTREAAVNVLAALTQWATGPDGTVALIDPATWTHWDRTRRATYCTTHGRVRSGLGHSVAAVCPLDAGCVPVPLFTLTPRED